MAEALAMKAALFDTTAVECGYFLDLACFSNSKPLSFFTDKSLSVDLQGILRWN
ncbi:hypothetical protein YC2023_106940 [Brassica napus]